MAVAFYRLHTSTPGGRSTVSGSLHVDSDHDAHLMALRVITDRTGAHHHLRGNAATVTTLEHWPVAGRIRQVATWHTSHSDDRGVVELHPSDPRATICGNCGRAWDDSVSTAWTPAPAGRCPFEYEHEGPA